MSHRRVWIEQSGGEHVQHPDECRERGTWCDDCGCCEHCYHDCECKACGCDGDWVGPEPVLHVVEDEP